LSPVLRSARRMDPAASRALSLHDALPISAPGERGPQQGPTREGGIAQKCTLCYDRLTDGQQPACAQTCPTESIMFGNHAELVARSEEHTSELQSRFDLVCRPLREKKKWPG